MNIIKLFIIVIGLTFIWPLSSSHAISLRDFGISKKVIDISAANRPPLQLDNCVLATQQYQSAKRRHDEKEQICHEADQLEQESLTVRQQSYGFIRVASRAPNAECTAFIHTESDRLWTEYLRLNQQWLEKDRLCRGGSHTLEVLQQELSEARQAVCIACQSWPDSLRNDRLSDDFAVTRCSTYWHGGTGEDQPNLNRTEEPSEEGEEGH